MTMIKGDTYPVRRQLAQMGGKWNAAEKGWEVPDDLAEEARRIVGPAPQPRPKAQPRDRNRSALRRSAIYTGETCACCGRGGQLIEDLEDGMMKHYGCCDIPSSR